ncbi:MAG: 4-alpha-glucanotransferase [Clostridia bacterium]|nr:4-alpha-glucanotransferase [Clostridia bacterium]
MKLKRTSGILAHISSIPGDYGIGSFGEQTFKFIDFLSESGFSIWQVLPFCVTDSYNSPYKSYGSFSLNPYFIDLQELYENGLLTKAELESAKQEKASPCEFVRLKAKRLDTLQKAAKRFGKVESLKPHTESFCRFMALRKSNGNSPWHGWTNYVPDDDALELWRFTQYMFLKQWGEIKKYANERNIKIIGDIPIYVSYDSTDVWETPEMFMLDSDKNPESVAGVPPDYFCPDGQLWGNPLYDWSVMKRSNFSWWRERIRFMTEIFDGIRLDHFRAFESFYAIPYGDETAKYGKWIKAEGYDFVDTIKPICNGKIMIAEDLGEITREVEKLVEYSGFYSTRVLQFVSPGDIHSPHLPENYNERCIAYTATHDNDTTRGFISKRAINTDRRQILEQMLESDAGIVVFPLQDILWLDSTARLNTPGNPNGNWGWRATREMIDKINRDELLNLNKRYGRFID